MLHFFLGLKNSVSANSVECRKSNHVLRLASRLVRLALLFLCASAAAQDTSQLGQWTWVGGSGNLPNNGCGYCFASGVYGTLGVPDPANIPGARSGSAYWRGKDGKLWFFGGFGGPGFHNDLWNYDPATRMWTWMNGSNTANQSGVYGSVGVAAPLNVPGARTEAMSWTDASGNLWLFGGMVADSSGAAMFLNDLWKWDVAAGEWTWMSGSSTVNQFGIYGTKRTASTGNSPGSRFGSATWIDSSGKLWLFGGEGFTAVAQKSCSCLLNDLWKFDPAARTWTWMGGSDRVSNPDRDGLEGVYGTRGVTAATNWPGAHLSSAAWTDKRGNFWMFGGKAVDAIGASGLFNDLWEYNPATQLWTWVTGPNVITAARDGDDSPYYGLLGVPGIGNRPGPRAYSETAQDLSGNVWLFGGEAIDVLRNDTSMNDLWRFNPDTQEWTWIQGSSIAGGGLEGTCGTVGVQTVYNDPGTRTNSALWADSTGRLWMFGGMGIDCKGANGWMNDLWEYELTQPPAVAPPTLAQSSMNYWVYLDVSMSSTPGADIYYTLDGSVPTASSLKYSSPIRFTTSGRYNVKAIAMKSGYAHSAITTAAYDVSILPSVGIVANPTSLDVNWGGTASTTLTLTPKEFRDGFFNLACTGMPSGGTCTLEPSSGTFAGASVTTKLTITAPATAATKSAPTAIAGRGLLSLAGLLLFWVRRRSLRVFALGAVLAVGVSVVASCGGGGSSGSSGAGVTPRTASYTLQVTASSLNTNGGTLNIPVTVH